MTNAPSENSTDHYTHSVVIPFYNERDNVISLLDELLAVEKQLGAVWEYILVNDCGTDGTPELLNCWASEHSACRLVNMPGNQGQAASLLAGLQRVTAPLIITMDGDGQNVPADIPSLLPLLKNADMVVGIRSERSDSWLRRAMSRFANRIRGSFLGDHVADSGCALKVFRREVIQALLPIRTLYSFMPAMIVAAGFTVTQSPVRHRARSFGTSNYGLRAFCWHPLVDMLGVLWFKGRCIKMNRPPTTRWRQVYSSVTHDAQDHIPADSCIHTGIHLFVHVSRIPVPERTR